MWTGIDKTDLQVKQSFEKQLKTKQAANVF